MGVTVLTAYQQLQTGNRLIIAAGCSDAFRSRPLSQNSNEPTGGKHPLLYSYIIEAEAEARARIILHPSSLRNLLRYKFGNKRSDWGFLCASPPVVVPMIDPTSSVPCSNY